jgi:hypothetical protein
VIEEADGDGSSVGTTADWAGGARDCAIDLMGGMVASNGGRVKLAKRQASLQVVSVSEIRTVGSDIEIEIETFFDKDRPSILFNQ